MRRVTDADSPMRPSSGPVTGGLPVRIRQDSDSVIAILKLVGQACNIDCLYCYERRKPDSGGVLGRAELEEFLAQLDGRRVQCILHGGEPLLIGKRRMTELLQVLADSDSVESLSIQTNATRIDEEWLALFDEFAPDMTWGVSYDGTSRLSKYRIDYQGRDTFAATERGMDVLGGGHDFGIISVITSAHVGGAVEYLESVAGRPGLASVKLIPCYDENVQTRPRATPSGNLMRQHAGEGTSGRPGWTVHPADYATFVEQVQGAWISTGAWRRFALEPTASIAKNLTGAEGTYTDYSLTKDGHLLTLYPGGRVVGHDRGDEFSVVESDVTAVAQFLETQFESTQKEWETFLLECASCEAWTGCRGGELFMRKVMSEAELSHEFCESRRAMVRSVEKLVTGDPS